MSGSKKCPKCAELVQMDALVCKHCRHKFETKTGLFSKIILAVVAIWILGVLFGGDTNETPIAPSAPSTSAVSMVRAKECAAVIERAKSAGIVKSQPQPFRIVVDEIAWALLPYTDKHGLLLAVACDSSFTSDKGGMEDFAEAYGYRNNQRIARLANDGADVKDLTVD